jgi:hypothetical protein
VRQDGDQRVLTVARNRARSDVLHEELEQRTAERVTALLEIPDLHHKESKGRRDHGRLDGGLAQAVVELAPTVEVGGPKSQIAARTLLAASDERPGPILLAVEGGRGTSEGGFD